MSASLVGSEMCIRDRSPLARVCGGGRLRGPAARGSAGRRARQAEPPVSYTHLTLPTICSV
eukprot:4307351-Alexandrium_andersonii.AAC.1